MARAVVTTQPISRAAGSISYTAPTVDGDTIDTGRVYLHVKNGAGSPITVTVQTPVTVSGLAVDDYTFTVPANGEALKGPYEVTTFGQSGANVGKAFVDYSAVTSVTRAVLGG